MLSQRSEFCKISLFICDLFSIKFVVLSLKIKFKPSFRAVSRLLFLKRSSLTSFMDEYFSGLLSNLNPLSVIDLTVSEAGFGIWFWFVIFLDSDFNEASLLLVFSFSNAAAIGEEREAHIKVPPRIADIGFFDNIFYSSLL